MRSGWFTATEAIVFLLWLHVVSIVWTGVSITVVTALRLVPRYDPSTVSLGLSPVDFVGFGLVLVSAVPVVMAAVRVAGRRPHAWGFTMAAEALVIPVSVIAWMLLVKVSGSSDVYETAAVNVGLAVLIIVGMTRPSVRRRLSAARESADRF